MLIQTEAHYHPVLCPMRSVIFSETNHEPRRLRGLVVSICYRKVVPKVHLQTILKAAHVSRDKIELEFRV